MSSFAFTPSEQSRVKVAAALGYHLDPISYKDLALIITISVVYGIDLLAVGFMLWNRNYPPLKSKRPLLMAAALASCICWFIGDLQINGHIHLAETGLTNCRGIGLWVRVLLGVCTVSSLIALRSYGLYRVFKQNRPYRGLGLYLPFLIYCGCTLVYGIIAQCIGAEKTVEYKPPLDLCYCPKPFRAALYVYIWTTWLFVAFVNWHIRGIKSSFNESREMAMACFFVFAILTFSTALQFAQPNYPFHQTQRLLTTAMDHLGTNLVWWAIMGEPLFNCAFRKMKYLEYWTSKLKKDGLQNEYEIGSSGSSGANNLTYDEDEEIFFFTPTTHPTPVYLPNGEPRPVSSKRRTKFAPNRYSDMTAVTKKLPKSLPIVPKSVDNYGDPFDIPPMTPTTAVNSPKSDDPFQRFSNSFRPTSQIYESERPNPTYLHENCTLAQESQSVLPPVGSALSVSSIVDRGLGSDSRRWSQSSTEDEDYVYATSPTNRHII
ncbi:hypothetical protein IWW39_001979 [Coemansia spiralis]|uniref:G-protein coupled receptors family 3 profile domain-containing protein n=1 Tax=Coemansia spiralis TaxID=417178 RepID=A0A9W8GGY8_9FUNG|nr:hypothetical protein IWW39_001979 [Coemansia spiralis]